LVARRRRGRWPRTRSNRQGGFTGWVTSRSLFDVDECACDMLALILLRAAEMLIIFFGFVEN
jgi:hypothetical protein